MSRKVAAIQYGCGPIGCRVAELALRRGVEVVGAIDVDPNKQGLDLGQVLGLGKQLGVVVSGEPDAVLAQTRADIVLHTTGSFLRDVYPQLVKAISAGLNIVSTSEELSYPWRKQPELAAMIDKLAKEHQVTVLGTGVNPGFLMDIWPLTMSAVCQEVTQIKVARIQDASVRRAPFQKKIGAGCTLDEFNRLVTAGTLRHVGLAESIAMIADGLGWELDEIREDIEPIVAEREVQSDFVTVKPGQAAGVRQVGHGLKAGKELIELDFQAYIGARESHDTVYITGTPNMEVTIKGGMHGDIATAAIVVNSIRRVIEAPPGLMTMKDLPIVCGTVSGS